MIAVVARVALACAAALAGMSAVSQVLIWMVR